MQLIRPRWNGKVLYSTFTLVVQSDKAVTLGECRAELPRFKSQPLPDNFTYTIYLVLY